MKKLTVSIVLLASVMFTTNVASAQEVTNNITHQISKKADKGELYDYYVNKEKGQIELAYKLKETPKKLLMETYIFKLSDLSFVKSFEQEFEKEKVRYKRVKQLEKNIRLLKVSPNYVTGKLKLKKGRLSYNDAGGYLISQFIKESETDVKTQQGDKFIYISHKTEMPETSAFGNLGGRPISLGVGNVSIMGMEKTTPYYSKYAFTIYDAHTTQEKLYKSFDLEFSYTPLSFKYLPNGDIGMVLQSIQKEQLPKTKGAANNFKINPDNDFRYVQINTKGDLVTNTSFKLKTSAKGGMYSIDIVATNKPNEVILLGVMKPDGFGAPKQLNPKFIPVANFNDKGVDIGVKATNAIAIKILDSKVVFNQEIAVADLVGKSNNTSGTKAPSDAQKYIRYAGFKSFQAVTDDAGNTLITGKCRNYHHTIQLDNQGNIAANYFDASNQDWCVNNQFITNDKNELFWINYDMPKHKDDASSEDKRKAYDKRTGVISKINPTSKKIEKTIDLTPEGISLDAEEAITFVDNKAVLVLGKGKKKEISLSKIVLN